MQESGLSLPGVHRSPNIQTSPDIYEIENIAADPDQRIEAAISMLAPWDGRVVLDLGAGTGFHTVRFHEAAAHVIAMEPHDPSRLRAMRRVADLGLERISVMTGSAERILLPDASVDLVHARFAYFFAPWCEPGLAELARVLRPGGTGCIIDNDLYHGLFARWLRYLPRRNEPEETDAFWEAHGFEQRRIASEWRFASRADLEAVVRLEFPGEVAERILREHEGTQVEYWYSLYYRHY